MGIIDVIFTNMPYGLPVNFDSVKMLTLHDCLACNNAFEHLKEKKLNKNDLSDIEKLQLTKILIELNIFALILEEVTKLFQINEETDTTVSNLQIEETINKTLFKYTSLINNEL